jgi:2-isopropylmalate synthase
MSETSHVRIFDTTLRDGEQSPGAHMTLDEKLLIARKLEELGVDVIEAGFPAASPGELESVRQIARAIQKSEVAALCRTRENDIQKAWQAIGDAAMPLLHVFIATSDLHLEYKLKMSRTQVLEEIRRGVGQCRSLSPRVEFSCEDATRTDLGFLREAVACAVESGASIINLPDTVGYTMPEEYKALVRAALEVIGGRPAIVSAHCHDDLGHAAANSLAAVSAGARQIECCVNGIGERAGNAALEEVVMALRTRQDLYGITTRIQTRHIVSASRLVSDITGFPVQPNKSIVGKNAFAHESGIHQHGFLKEKRTYEIMLPEDVGLSESRIVLGKLSGRFALVHRLGALGYQLDDSRTDRIFERFKLLADKKKEIHDEDLHALVADDAFRIPQRYELVSIEFSGGTHAPPKATATVIMDGARVSAESSGDGPVNAVIEAIKVCTGRQAATLADYSLSAIGAGSDAQGRVNLSLSDDGVISRGQATHTDVVAASAQAFVNALNNYQAHQAELKIRQQKQATNA